MEVSVEAAWPAASLAAELLEGLSQLDRGGEGSKVRHVLQEASYGYGHILIYIYMILCIYDIYNIMYIYNIMCIYI